MPPLIPSSQADLPELGPQATDIVPGSDVQKQTALRQGTLPPVPNISTAPSTLDRVMAAMFAGGTAYTKGGDQAIEAITRMRNLADESKARKVIGYITQLQAATTADPSLSKQALSDLQQLAAEQGINMPTSAQSWVEKGLATLQANFKMDGMRRALTEIGPNGGPQLQAAMRAINAGVEPAAAIELGKLWSNKETTLVPGRDGHIYQASKDPKTGDISLVNIDPPGYLAKGPGLDYFRTLPARVKELVTSDAAKLPGGSLPEFMNRIIEGDESANKILATYHTRAEAEAEARGEKASQRQIERMEAARDQLPPATRMAVKGASQMFPGLFTGKETKFSELSEAHMAAINEYQMKQKSDAQVRSALSDPKSGVKVFDKDGNTVPPGPHNIEDIVKGRGETYFLTDKATGERALSLRELAVRIQNFNAIAQTTLAAAKDLPAGTSFLQSAQFAFSKHFIPNDAKWLEDEAKDIGFQISKGLWNTARSNMMGEAGQRAFYERGDSKELQAKKSKFVLDQINNLWRAELGILPNYRWDLKETERALPELKGRLGKDRNLPGANESDIAPDVHPRDPNRQRPYTLAPLQPAIEAVKGAVNAGHLLENVIP